MAMSRVEEDAAKAAADAERLAKKIDREVRDKKTNETGREAFAKLVKNQAGAQVAKGKGEKQQSETQQGDAQAGKTQKSAADGERAARMSRGGLAQQSKAMEQAKSFQGVLTNQQSSTQQTDQGRVVRRDQGKTKDKVDRDDREVDVKKQETKRDVEADIARVEAHEQNRANAAISADAGGGDSDQRGKEGPAAGLQKASTLQAAKGAQAAREVKQIPPELLEKLASAVYLGVNDKGLKEFQIELKDGPLKGAFLKISAEDGKVALKFEGLGAHEKNHIKASLGERVFHRSGFRGAGESPILSHPG